MAARVCVECTTVYAVGAPRCPHCGSIEWTDGPAGSVLPSVTVECVNGDCAYQGKQRRVHLRTAAPGVLEMPLLVCAGCGLAMSRVAPWPPVTGAEDSVPKITKLGGPSNRFAHPENAGAVNDTPAAAAPAPDEQQGGEQPSHGNSSSPSPASTPTSSESSEKPRPPRARKTVSRSKKAQTGSSSARSTDGDPTEPPSDAD